MAILTGPPSVRSPESPTSPESGSSDLGAQRLISFAFLLWLLTRNPREHALQQRSHSCELPCTDHHVPDRLEVLPARQAPLLHAPFCHSALYRRSPNPHSS